MKIALPEKNFKSLVSEIGKLIISLSLDI